MAIAPSAEGDPAPKAKKRAEDQIDSQPDAKVSRLDPAPRVLRDLFVAEFGPRIEPDHQPYLKALLHKLGIREEEGQPKWSDLVPFSPYRGEPPTEPKFTLEGEEAEQTTLIDLLLLALRRVCEILSLTV